MTEDDTTIYSNVGFLKIIKYDTKQQHNIIHYKAIRNNHPNKVLAFCFFGTNPRSSYLKINIILNNRKSLVH